jgi:hypothetical protein
MLTTRICRSGRTRRVLVLAASLAALLPDSVRAQAEIDVLEPPAPSVTCGHRRVREALGDELIGDPRGLRAPAGPPRYVVFPDRAAALTWYAGLLPILNQAGLQLGNPAPESDRGWAVLEGMVAEQWPIFQRLATQRVGELPPPQVMLIASQELNAFAMRDPRTGQLPHAIFVLAPALQLEPEALKAIIAHELSHHALGHTDPAIEQQITRYYRARGQEPLGYLQRDDAAVRNRVETWLGHAAMVGPFVDDDFGGLPLPTLGMPVLGELLFHVVRRYSRDARPECTTLRRAGQEMFASLRGAVSPAFLAFDLDSQNRSQLRSASARFRDAARGCLNGPEDALLPAAVQLFQTPAERLLRGASPEELEIFRAEAPFIDSLVELSLLHFGEMRQLMEGYAWDELRSYTTEDSADENASRVLSGIGYPEGAMARGLQPLMDEASWRACAEVLDRGEVPPFGALTDPHHSTCYRIYHIRAFDRHMRSASN